MNKTNAIHDRNEKQLQNTPNELHQIKVDKLGHQIPKTEQSLQLKLVKKIPANKSSAKNLQGLYEVLTPGSNILEDDDVTHVIKEQGKRQVSVKIGNLGIAVKKQREKPHSKSTRKEDEKHRRGKHRG